MESKVTRVWLHHAEKNSSGSTWYAHGKFVFFRHISFLPWNNVKLIPETWCLKLKGLIYKPGGGCWTEIF